jgi:hypothetical protein
LKKSPTGPAFTKDPLKKKSGITSNNKRSTFIADPSVNRLVCLRWISKSQRKEKIPFETWGTTQNPPQTLTALLDIVTDAAVTQWLLWNYC